jgi:hypothetical protein
MVMAPPLTFTFDASKPKVRVDSIPTAAKASLISMRSRRSGQRVPVRRHEQLVLAQAETLGSTKRYAILGNSRTTNSGTCNDGNTGAIALVPRVPLISFWVSALMTWIVQPRLALLLERWLYAPRRSR